ncbi:hypothetical protein CGCS363_v002560 [Colletotrichum siamense]|uniref:uncharacterized protein n=1 Tax=Colletotrichum siamense TaxID=690259 RepID=UPI0018728F0D|nr:uncharacterized protein CGCS363_v002560 [Colletotrichum siamense]KAF5511720.1 hypothetical protein CGCS363_v002560 [Colletotrichum siamense]
MSMMKMLLMILKKVVEEIKKQVLQRDPETTLDWSLSEGIVAVQLRNNVVDLSKAISKQYLNNLAAHVKKGHEEAPSDAELDRIQRALYRFETYCNIFPPLGAYLYPADDVREEWTTFFESSPSWEIEQVGSVHESLFRLVAPVFNDCALHDISWGWDEVRYAYDYEDGRVEWVLSRGLVHVNRVLHATSFHERWLLFGGRKVLEHDCNWLYQTFETYKNLFVANRIGWMPSKTRHVKSEETALEDSISPVEKIWEWSHGEFYEDSGDGRYRYDMAMEDPFRPLRACGYVFWGEERVKRIGWFDQNVDDLELDVGEEIYKNSPSLRLEIRSWIIRSNLFQEGKTGYWDGDPENTAINPSQEWRLAED